MALGQREIPDTATPEARAWMSRALELREEKEGQHETFEVRCCNQLASWQDGQLVCWECGWATTTLAIITAHGLESLGLVPVPSETITI